MGQINLPAGDYLQSQLKELSDRVTAMETTQQFVVTNVNNVPIVQIGVFSNYPSSPTYGIKILDTHDNVRAELGLLPKGDYGLFITDSSGHGQEILPSYSDYDQAGTTASSTTFVTYANSPTFQFTCGDSGDFLFTVSSYIGCPTSTTGEIQFRVYDPSNTLVASNVVCVLSESGAGVGIAGTMSATNLFSLWHGSTLTPGTVYTAALYYSSSNTSTCSYANIFLNVQPI